MKNYIKKQIKNLAIFLMKLASKWFYTDLIFFYEKQIKKAYQFLRREEFQITEKIINVKKGKIKYKVIYFETSGQTTKAIISRHFEKNQTVLI
jgi:hypothetical protein